MSETRIPKELIRDLVESNGDKTNILVYEGVLNTDENAVIIDQLVDEPTYIEVYLDGSKLLLSEYKYKDSVVRLNTPVQKDTNYNITIFQKANITIKTNTETDSYFESQEFEEIETGENLDVSTGTLHFIASSDASGINLFPGHPEINISDFDVYINDEHTDLALNNLSYSTDNDVKITSSSTCQTNFPIPQFNSQTTIKSIEEPLPKCHNSDGEPSTAATSFSNSGNITIPENLYINNPQFTEFNSVFSNSGIIDIPENIFSYAPNATNFNLTFFNTSITRAANYFSQNTKASTFYSTFGYCTNLTYIPADIFANCSEATSFSNTFYKCSKLASVSADLFRYNTNVTNFNGVFDSTNLSSINADLFKYNTEVTNFSNVLAHTQITSIPSALFSYNSKVTDFSYAFFSCPKLTSIPGTLFDNNTEAKDFQRVFANCSNLTTIGTDLFKQCTSANNFSYAFMSCSKVTSALPTIWSWRPAATHTYCFQHCTSATNYSAAQSAGWA